MTAKTTNNIMKEEYTLIDKASSSESSMIKLSVVGEEIAFEVASVMLQSEVL